MRGTGRTWSVLTLLLAYGLLALLPILGIGGYLLVRVAHAERLQLEERVHQIAEAVGRDVERELQRRITVLETLATSPRIWQGDFAGFHEQAKAAVGKDELVILLHDAVTRQQLVNTFVELDTSSDDWRPRDVRPGAPGQTCRNFGCVHEPGVEDFCSRHRFPAREER